MLSTHESVSDVAAAASWEELGHSDGDNSVSESLEGV